MDDRLGNDLNGLVLVAFGHFVLSIENHAK